MNHVQERALGLVTPYDVHKTILHLAGLATQPPPSSFPSFGVSLLESIVSLRTCEGAGVPAANCLWLSSTEQSKMANHSLHSTVKRCEPMPLPPSVSSYYADMPVENRGRASLIDCDGEKEAERVDRVSEVLRVKKKARVPQAASGSFKNKSYVENR